jgi:hypothetical protein
VPRSSTTTGSAALPVLFDRRLSSSSSLLRCSPRYTDAIDHAGRDGLADAEELARATGCGVLAALVPWELAVTGRRPRFEVVWWSTAALIAVLAIGEAVGAQSSGLDVVDIATGWSPSATAATVRLVVRWRGYSLRRRSACRLARSRCRRRGLAVVPERFGIWEWRFSGGDVVGPLLSSPRFPC